MERFTKKNEFFEYVLPEQNIFGDNQATEISLGGTEYTCKLHITGEAIKRFGELEDVLEEFELTSAEDLRNYLNFKTNMAIWEGELNYKNKIAELEQELAELKHKLKVSEIATKLACERVKYFEEMQDREMGFEDLFGYESNYDLQGIIEQYKEQAEKEVKGE